MSIGFRKTRTLDSHTMCRIRCGEKNPLVEERAASLENITPNTRLSTRQDLTWFLFKFHIDVGNIDEAGELAGNIDEVGELPAAVDEAREVVGAELRTGDGGEDKWAWPTAQRTTARCGSVVFDKSLT